MCVRVRVAVAVTTGVCVLVAVAVAVAVRVRVVETMWRELSACSRQAKLYRMPISLAISLVTIMPLESCTRLRLSEISELHSAS